MYITGWAVFWVFMIVFFCVDSFLYWKGYDTFFWKHKTDAELQHQRKKLGLH